MLRSYAVARLSDPQAPHRDYRKCSILFNVNLKTTYGKHSRSFSHHLPCNPCLAFFVVGLQVQQISFGDIYCCYSYQLGHQPSAGDGGSSRLNLARQRTLRMSAMLRAITWGDLSLYLERRPGHLLPNSSCSRQDARKKARCGMGPLSVFVEILRNRTRRRSRVGKLSRQVS